MGILEDATNWLHGQRHEHMTVAIAYQRGAHMVSLAATRGSSEFAMNTEAGTMLEFQSRDYLIRAADLVLDEEAITPRHGDLITDAGKTYTVTGPGGAPPFRFSDSSHTQMRIHTKAGLQP